MQRSRIGLASIGALRRGRPLLALAAVFAAIALLTGRSRGLRALLGLAVSFSVAVRFVVPAIAAGRSIGLMLAVPLTTALAAWLALQAAPGRLEPAHAH